MSKYINLRDWQAAKIQNIGLLVEVLKPQPISSECFGKRIDCYNEKNKSVGMEIGFGEGEEVNEFIKLNISIGDTLLCRESWCKLCRVDENGITNYDDCSYYYKADGEYQINLYDDAGRYLDDQRMRFRSPVTMPAEAIRHKLMVKGVWVKRVQELTNEEIKLAGINYALSKEMEIDGLTYKSVFRTIWDKDHKKQEEKYESNPYVICYGVEAV